MFIKLKNGDYKFSGIKDFAEKLKIKMKENNGPEVIFQPKKLFRYSKNGKGILLASSIIMSQKEFKDVEISLENFIDMVYNKMAKRENFSEYETLWITDIYLTNKEESLDDSFLLTIEGFIKFKQDDLENHMNEYSDNLK